MSTLSARGIAPVLALLQRPLSSTTMLPRCLIIVQKSTEGGLTNGLAKHDAHLPERTRHTVAAAAVRSTYFIKAR